MSVLIKFFKSFISLLRKGGKKTVSNSDTTVSTTLPPLTLTQDIPDPVIITTTTVVPLPVISDKTSIDVFYDKVLPLTLIFEGGFTDNPKDRGGRTNYGITQRVYNKYLWGKGISYGDVKDISIEEVREIYYKGYWEPSKCPEMPEKVSVVVFDTSVNSGQGRSIKTLQRAIGTKVDGVVGPDTLSKLKLYFNTHDQMALVNGFLKVRDDFYRSLVKKDTTQEIFLNGWLRRLKFLKDYLSGAKTLEDIRRDW